MKNVYQNSDTIIAPITSSVGGSISMIRISGKDAINISNKFFIDKNLSESEGGRFYFGKLKKQNNELIDEVVLLVYKNPHSFTGEDTVEISTHANPFILKDVLKLFLDNGCRLAEPGEFSRRAFLNGKMDLLQAEAIADIISAKSKIVLKNSMEQLEGKLSSIISDLKSELIEVAGLLELDLDFTEEGLEIIDNVQIVGVVERSLSKIEQLLSSYKNSKSLKKGVEVLITGKPNVGKSSLMNALLEKDRVIVSSIPGTTRDVIHEDILLDNILVRFIDTAGIRFSDNSIEAEGVDRAKRFFDKADLILIIIDGSEKLSREDENIIKAIHPLYKDKALLVVNKMDKHIDSSYLNTTKKYTIDSINISAKENLYISELKERIRLRIYEIEKFISEEILVTNERQFSILLNIKKALLQVKEGLQNKMGYEFIAIDIRNAIEFLSEITGEITTDDIMNKIFSSFCIGK